MATHLHQCRGQLFRIDVAAVALTPGAPAAFFVANIRRIDRGRTVTVRGKRGRQEVCGATEAWAVKNARMLIDCGAWFVSAA
jgi:hypothetical protein